MFEYLGSQHHLLKWLPFPYWIVFASLSKIIWPCLWRFLDFVFFWSVCCLYASTTLFWSFVVSLKLESVSLPTLFYFKIVLAIWASLSFHMNFRMDFLFWPKNHWNFDRSCIKSVDQYSIYILTILSVPVHECGVSFHLSVSS